MDTGLLTFEQRLEQVVEQHATEMQQDLKIKSGDVLENWATGNRITVTTTDGKMVDYFRHEANGLGLSEFTKPYYVISALYQKVKPNN